MGFRRSLDFLPSFFRTETNAKFLNATLDQLTSEPDLKKLDGYVGRKFAPSYKPGDGYLVEPTALRQNYQLEPSTVYKDESGKIKFVSTYQDLTNRVSSLGGIVGDNSRLFASKQYTYDGQFDFDKFANFSSYYWLPEGPDAVDVYSLPVDTQITFEVTPPRIYQVVSGDYERESYDSTGFDVSSNPIARLREDGFRFSGTDYVGKVNPPLRLARGGTYTFNLDQIGHGFFIQTQPGLSLSEDWQNNLSIREVFGVTNNGNDVGTITFNVPSKDAQDFYVSLESAGSANLVAQSKKKNRPLRYIEVQNQAYDAILTAHSGIDGQRYVEGKTIVFLPDPALTAIPVSWAAYTTYADGDLIRYGNTLYRATTSFVTGRTFNTTNLEIYDSTDDWYDPSLFDSDDTSYDDTGFDRGDDVPQEKRTGRFLVTIVDGLIKLVPTSLIAVNEKVDILEGIKYGNRQAMHTSDDELQIIPNITANYDFLYYQDSLDANINGIIELVDQTDLPDLNVTDAILGKKVYTSPNGVAFTNGMKVKFRDTTVPESYSLKEFYVEGVGNSINLVPTEELVTPETWLDTLSTEYDITLFDSGPFDAQVSSPLAKDYIVINRASRDRSAWSRGNRWFHQDVVNATATYNNYPPVLEYSSRANRPIIEFNPDLQLYNFGRKAKLPVTLMDLVTTDAFSDVEGMTVEEVEGRISSYVVDSVPLIDGLTIIFAADLDENVRNKIYTVSWIRPQSSSDERTANFTGDGSTLAFDLNFDVTSTLNLEVQVDGVNANNAGYIWSIEDSQILTFSTAIPDNANVTATLVYKSQIHLELLDSDINDYDTVTIEEGLTNQGNQFYFLNDSWILGQNKTSTNQAPLFDLLDQDEVSLSDTTKYPSNTFVGNKIFGYQTSDVGVTDSELGFKVKHRTFNNVGDILFADYINKSTFNYRVGVESIQKSTQGNRIQHNLADGTSELINQWIANEYKTQQYQTQTYFATQYQKNLFPLNIVPIDRTEPLDPTSILVYVNNRSINSNLYDIQLEGTQGYLLLDTDLTVGDKLDIRVASSSHNDRSVFEIPPALEFNPLNSEISDFSLGQMRSHITKVYENTPGLRGEFIGQNNSRDLGNFKKYGGTIVQNLGSPHLANLFLNDIQANFVESVLYSQKEYTRFKNKFLEMLYSMPLTNPNDAVLSVDEVIAEIGYNKSHMFPFFASDMLAHGTDYKKLTYTVVDADVTTFDLTSIFDDTVPSGKSINVYLNGAQLLKGLEYRFLAGQPVIEIIVADTQDASNLSTIVLNEGDVVQIREYATTDGSHVPPTPTKLGLGPLFTPAIVTDGYDTNPRDALRGHDGSLTALFGDHRDDALMEFEKRIYNNIKVTYNGDLHDIRDYLPGGFKTTPYSKQEYDLILSSSFNTWLGQTGLRTSDYHTFDSNDPWSWNYAKTTSKVDGKQMPAGYWRGIFKYYFDTDAPHLRPWEMLGFTEEPNWWKYHYGPAPYTRGNAVLWNDLEEGRILEGTRAGVDVRYARPGLINYIPVDEHGIMLSPLDCIVKEYNSTDVSGNFVFGDGGPVETAWRQSSEYPFAMQIAMALMNPAEYFGANINKNTQVLREFGTGNKQWVYSDTGLRQDLLQLIHGETDANGDVVRVNGYVTWISEYAKSLGLDVTTSVGDKLRKSTVQFSYKMAGYSDKKYLRIYADQATPNSTNPSITIPDEDYSIVLNKSAPLANITYSGVIVTKTPDGFSVNGYDDNKPYFTIETSSTTGRKEYVKVGNLAVDKYIDGTGTLMQVPYGTEFVTPSQVVDFIVSYGRYLASMGFLFNDKLDEDAGFYKDWDLAAREFLFYVQQGWDQDVAISLSPVGNSLSFRASNGVIDSLTDRVNGTRVLNEDFKILRADEYAVNRQGRDFRLSIDDPRGIYLLDVDLVNYEHVIVFENTTRFNDVVYDPIIGARQYRLKVSGFKTGGWDGSFGAAGFIINDDNIEEYQPGKNYYKGDIVKFKNTYYTAAANISGDINFDLQSWIKSDYSKINKGLLPNLTNKAGKSKTFYDIEDVNLELDADRLGKGLIGLRPRSYLTDLQIGDTSQVKFYQGMITQKGSRNSLDKLLRAKLDNFDGEVNFYEEWAIRAGQYGATDARQQLQMIVNEGDAVRDPALIELLDDNDNPTDGRVSYKAVDLWVKPRVYSKNYLGTRGRGSIKGDLPNAGYVRLDDVDWTSPSITALNTSVDLAKVKQGDQIAIAVNQVNLWDVVRIDETGVFLTALAIAPNGVATFEFNKAHDLAIDEVVLIKTANNKPAVTGFYTVKTIPSSTTITVQTNFGTLNGFKVNGTLFNLISQRFADVSDIPAAEPMLGWQIGDKLFVDNASDNGWGVYEKTEGFKSATSYYPADPDSITGTPATTNDSLFGTTLSVDRSTTFMLVGQPGDESAISYSIVNQYLLQDLYIVSPVTGASGFGSAVSISSTGIGVIAAPTSNSNLGYVHVLKINPTTSKYDIIQVLAAPDLDANGKFGSTVAVSDDGNWLAVGQPNVDGGYVYVYQLVDRAVPPPTSQTFTGDGSTLSFTLTGTAANPQSLSVITVSVNGTTINPTDDFSLSGSIVTLVDAPANGDEIVVTVVRDNPVIEFIGDGSTTAFALTGDSATPTNVYNLQVVVDGVLLVPFVDYDLSGNNVQFVTAPADASTITIKQLDFFTLVQGFTASDNVNGDRFGDSLYFTDDGRRLVIGAPNATVSAKANAGKAYVYDRSVIEITGDGETATFAVDVQTLLSKVTKNGVVQTQDIGYGGEYEVTGGDIVFATAPSDGEIVTIENNFMLETAILANTTNEVGAKLGTSVLICPANCSVYSGAPYVDGTNNSDDAGTVTRWINQGRLYGTITGTVSNPVLTATGYLIVNDRWVTVTSGFTLTQVVSAITNADIPGVTVSIVANKLKIDTNSLVVANKLVIAATERQILLDLGLEIYAETQVIASPTNEAFGNFGKKLGITPDSETLIIASDRATSRVPTIFDSEDTTFDTGATNFVFDSTQSGAVFTYQLISRPDATVDNPSIFIPAQKLVNSSIDPLDQFGASIGVSQTTIFVGAPGDDTYASNGGAVFSFKIDNYAQAWVETRHEVEKINHNLINRVSLVDSKQNKIVTDLDFIDPFKGKISGVAAQEITYRTSYDPATYNYTNDNKAQTPAGVLWGASQVGQVWWNTSATRWMEYEQGDIDFRLANWGTAFPESTILCYEWTESNFPPTKYVDPANPLSYATNAGYSRIEYIDQAGTVQVKYYYWVAAKETVPHMESRSLSTVQIERLIANPKSEGVAYAAFIAPNAIALYNCKKFLRSDDIILSIDYDVIENDDNIHAEYQLVSEGDANSKPTADIITKLIDSLAGSDADGRLVPDVALTAGRRYGKEFRPRQTMFRDRQAALKVAVDYINSKILWTPIVQSRNLENLFASEAQPTEASLEWNEKVLDKTELGYLNTAILAIGYKVLVESDEDVQNRWAIYTLAFEDDGITRYWKLYRVQAYNNADFLKYVNWVAPGVTLSPITDYVVDYLYQLNELSVADGSTVKVKDDGRGLYTIVQYNGTTESWNTISLENATVQIIDGIWDQTVTLQGYDAESFDLQLYDSWANIEIQNILRAVYEDVFVDELEVEANSWFFMMMQHLLQEQKYVDWLFKSSFIKVEQRQETIKQVVAYQLDNQELLRDYINETKPFHTKIREYVLKYDGSEQSDADVTDFDVPAYYIAESGRYRSPNGSETIDEFILDIESYRPWRDNHTFSIDEIEVVLGGELYEVAPTILIEGGGGTGAIAEADILNGVVIGVRVIDPGEGYITTPTVTAVSGSGTGALLVPRMTNNKIRKIASTLKFDRISTRFSSFLVQFIDGAGDPVDVRNEQISRVTGEAGVIDLLLDAVSDGAWIADSLTEVGFPVSVPNYYVFNDASGRVIVDYRRVGGKLTEYDLTVALRALGGGVHALDLDGTTVVVDDSVVNYNSIVTDWEAGVQYSPGDIVSHLGVAFKANTRFISGTTFEIDPVAIEISANTDDYVFNIGSADEWQELHTYSTGEFFVNPNRLDRLYKVTKNFTSGTEFAVESLVAMTGDDFESHLDRTWAYYNPKSGQYGKDLSQLFAGVTYPGVNVRGPRFDQEPGFDVAAYDIESYDRFIIGPEGLKVLDPATLDQTIWSEFTDTLLGTRPEDIIVYGNGFVDTYLSHAPEEMVPGAVFDTLDVKVYSTPSDDWLGVGIGFDLVLTTRNYTTSNATYMFDVPTGTLDKVSVFSVEAGRLIRDVDYTVDWIDHTVTILATLLNDDKLFIYATSEGGEGLQFTGAYETDGTTDTWSIPVDSDLVDQVYVLVNGDRVTNFTVTGSDVVFDTAPAANQLLTLHVFSSSDSQQKFSDSVGQLFTATAGVYPNDFTFTLNQEIGYEFPYAEKIIVEVNGSRLRPPNQAYYTGDGSTLTFQLPTTVYVDPDDVYESQVRVAVDGVQSQINVSWILSTSDGSTMPTVIFTDPPVDGAEIVIQLTKDSDYQVVDSTTILIEEAVGITAGDEIYIQSYTSHDPLKIRTQVYKGTNTNSATVTTGWDDTPYDSDAYESDTTVLSTVTTYELSRPVTKTNYLRVTLDLAGGHTGGRYLFPGIDYKLISPTVIEVGSGVGVNPDSILVVTSFYEVGQKPSIGFRVFHDMRGQVTYTRLSDSNKTTLASNLGITDTVIYVTDASKLGEPDLNHNEPGVVFVDAERITYYTRDLATNTLGQIRRGASGTAITTHTAATEVVDAGSSQAIPEASSQVWYTPGESTASDGLGLQNSDTKQAKFLLASPVTPPAITG